MTTFSHFVPYVPGLCRGLCRGFRLCAGCAGASTYARAPQTTKPPHHKKKLSCVYVSGTPGTPGTRLIHIRIFTRHPAHMLTHPAHASRARSLPIFSFKKKMMEDPGPTPATRCIHCTQENARAMQQAVKDWPQLHGLVQRLQSQNLFPGLRALSITLTGSESFMAKGLAAVTEINASKAV